MLRKSLKARSSILLALAILLAGSAVGFESDRTGSGGPPVSDAQCWNGVDDDDDGNTPPDGSNDRGPFNSEPGCVNPYWEDEIEGLIWSSHMSSVLEGTLDESSPAPYFSDGFVEMGNDINSNRESNSLSGEGESTSYQTYYVDQDGSESTDNWGFGVRESVTLTDFPAGSVVEDDRVVLPPNPRSDDTSTNIFARCGNGIENSEHSRTEPEGDDTSNQPGSLSGYTSQCRADWGRRWERYDVSNRGSESPAESSSQTGNTFTDHNGLQCRDDDQYASGNTIDFNCQDATDASCSSGSSSCGCGSATGSNGDDAYCDVESSRDWSSDEEHEYWLIDGEDLVLESCEYQTTRTYDSGSAGSDDTCTSYSSNTVNGSCVSCSSSGSTTWYGGDDISVRGKDRDWEEVGRDDCNVHNIVDGGTSNPSDYENSDAATFTDFTAYRDMDWTDTGRVWCGHDYTTTIDADGAWGYGNGFVVIYDGEIVATENPQGYDEVGNHVWVDGSRDSSIDLIDEGVVDSSCPDGKNACIKYANFYTTDSGWSSGDNPSDSEIVDAVDVETKTVTPDESYSVCKNINRINEENGDSRGDDLIDCDYMKDGDNISPLSEACGDESQEHLMVMEGPAVDSSTSEDWLGHEQKCVDWSSDGDEDANDASRELTRSACVNQGQAYAEGTVMNVASERISENVYPYTEEGWETGGDSPDLEVCLDLQEDNNQYTDSEMSPKPYNYRHDDKGNEYYGGQWYDLDDPRINEYLQDMEDGGESWTPNKLDNIDSEEAGQSAQDIDFIDYYYTENPNPYHEDYNPLGEGSPRDNRGTAVLADCGPGIECGDDSGEERSEVNSQSSGDETYFAFSNPSGNSFAKWSREEDYHPQGRWNRSYNEYLGLDYSITSDRPQNSRQSYDSSLIDAKPSFTGYIVQARSSSDQLDQSHPDFDYLGLSSSSDEDWWYDTNVDEDSAVQYAYAEGPDWGVDSTGVPYPPGGQSYSTGYVNEGDAEAGNYRHIDAENSPRTTIVDDSINKTDKAHGNSILVVASDSNPDYDEGQAYWINPDDITSQWEQDHIDRAYW